MKFNLKIRNYILIVLGAYTIIASLIATNYFVLYRTGEMDDLDKIVATQQKNSGLYNGLSRGMAAYKYEGYRQRQPEIVAIGTSRAMQIRDYFFTRPFYNLGGLVHGQAQAFALLDRLLMKQLPKTVIFAVDFWTFCARKSEFPPFERPTGSYHDGQGNPSNALLFLRLFADGRLSGEDLGQIFQYLFYPRHRALPRIGISTVTGDSGFGPDGSMFSFLSKGNDNRLPEIKNRSKHDIETMRRGQGMFPSNCKVSEENLTLISMLGAELSKHEIELIVIAPPITSALLSAVKDVPAANDYMKAWRIRLKEAWHRTYDFTDPSVIGASDCEFYDGIHGGEVAYARIFRTLAALEPESIAPLLNVKNLDRVIAMGDNQITVALGLPEKVRNLELAGFKACSSLP